MKKKTLAFFLLASLVMAFTACTTTSRNGCQVSSGMVGYK